MLSKHDIATRDRWLANTFLILDHFLGRANVNKLLAGVRDALHEHISHKLSKKIKGALYPIDRREGLTPREFRHDYMRQGLPVVLAGAAKDWPCSKKWSFEYFARYYGDEQTYVSRHEGLFDKEKEGFDGFDTLKELIWNVEAKGGKYLRFSTLVDKYPELREDLDEEYLEKYQRTLLGSGTQFFLGSQGSFTRVHAAASSNLFLMIRGSKKWLLYPAFYTPIFRPPTTHEGYLHSPVDVRNPDLQAFPELKYLDGYEATLEEGDILYNPPFMWHYIENLTDTIAVAYRFPHFRAAFRASLTLMFLRFFATNPSPFGQLLRLVNPEQDDTKAGHLVVRYWSGLKRKQMRKKNRQQAKAA